MNKKLYLTPSIWELQVYSYTTLCGSPEETPPTIPGDDKPGEWEKAPRVKTV